MSLTVCMTMNDRPAEVMDSVFTSFSTFPGNDTYDEMVIVNDRGDHGAIQASLDRAKLKARIVDINGKPGRGPQAPPWNLAFAEVRTSHAYCISSDCIQLPWSVQIGAWCARRFPDMVTMGRAEHCGRKYSFKYRDTFIKTMVSSYMGQPEGFAWVLPMDLIRKLDPPGYDERLTGYCYEHVDLVIRILESGTPILRCDDICAVHIEHPKPYIYDKDAIEHNRTVFESIHGKHSNTWAHDHGYKGWLIGSGIAMNTCDEDRVGEVAQVFQTHYNWLT